MHGAAYAGGNINVALSNVLGTNFVFSLAAKTKTWHDATNARSATGSLERRRTPRGCMPLLSGCTSLTASCSCQGLSQHANLRGLE